MKQKLTIFHIAAFPYISGGIDTWLNSFLRALDDKCEFDILCPGYPRAEQPIFAIPSGIGARIHYVGGFTSFSGMGIWALRVTLRALRLEIRDSPAIVLGTIPGMLAPVILKRLGYLRGPIICSVRGALVQDARDTKKSRFFTNAVKTLEQFLLRQADIVVANGWDTQDYLNQEHQCPSVVIPNALESHASRHNPEDTDLEFLRAGKALGRIIVLHVGTVRRVKGIDAIIEAFALLSEPIRARISLLFVGKGQLEQYRQKCRDLSVTPMFLGQKANVDDYYSLADFVVNVSGGAGVSNSLLETLAHGVPVICWSRKTFTQVVTDGQNGIVCPQGDVHALARSLERIALGEYSFNSTRIRETVKSFTWGQIGPQWWSLISNSTTSGQGRTASTAE